MNEQMNIPTQQDEAISNRFRLKYPLSFKLEDLGENPALSALADASGQEMVLLVMNVSNGEITIPAETEAIVVRFRPGVLKNAGNITLAGSEEWSAEVHYPAHLETSIHLTTAKPVRLSRGETLSLRFQNIQVDSAYGAYNTRVTFHVNKLQSAGRELNMDAERTLSVIDQHPPEKRTGGTAADALPMMVGFKGANSVLNVPQAKTNEDDPGSTVTVQLTNIGEKDMIFKTDNSYVTLHFDEQDADQKSWALGETGMIAKIAPFFNWNNLKNVPKGGNGKQDPEGFQSVWTFKPEKTIRLEPGHAFELVIQHILTTLPNGPTNLYLDCTEVYYDDASGKEKKHPEGKFCLQLIKSPLVTREHRVGIGTSDPLHDLDVRGSALGLYNESGNASLIVGKKAEKGVGALYFTQGGNDEEQCYAVIGGLRSNDLSFRMKRPDVGAEAALSLFLRGADGKVGVNTVNPDGQLTVKGSTQDKSESALNVTDSANQPLLTVRNDGSLGIGSPDIQHPLDVRGEALGLYNNKGDARIYIGKRRTADHSAVVFTDGEAGPANGFAEIGGTGSNDLQMKVNPQKGSPQSTPSLFLKAADGKVGINTTTPNARLTVKGATQDATENALQVTDSANKNLLSLQNDGEFKLFNPKKNVAVFTVAQDGIVQSVYHHRMYPANPVEIYDGDEKDIFQAVADYRISPLRAESKYGYDNTTYAKNKWNGRKAIRFGHNYSDNDNYAIVRLPAGADTIWIRVFGERDNIVQLWKGESLGFYGGGHRYLNSYCPDGSLNDGFDVEEALVHQWMAFPGLSPGEHFLVPRDGTQNGFWISGLAFTKNPWNHATQSALGFWGGSGSVGDTNGGKRVPANGDDWNWERDVCGSMAGNQKWNIKVPVVPSDRDKLLYIVEHNNDWHGTAHKSIKIDGTQVERFLATYDNPFARHWNSKFRNRYIAARIPANLVPAGSRFLNVEIDLMETGALGIFFREIGTHDYQVPVE